MSEEGAERLVAAAGVAVTEGEVASLRLQLVALKRERDELETKVT